MALLARGSNTMSAINVQGHKKKKEKNNNRALYGFFLVYGSLTLII